MEDRITTDGGSDPGAYDNDLELDAVPTATTPCHDDVTVPNYVTSVQVAQQVSKDRGGVCVQVHRVKGGDVVIGDKWIQHVRYETPVKNVFKPTAGYEQVKDQSRADVKSAENVFVETRHYREAVRLLRQHGVLLICGPPGSGMTTLGRALLRHFESEGYTPLVLHRHAEWRQFVGGIQKMVVLLDNIFGEICIDQRRFTKWSKSFSCISEFAKESKCLTVLVMYTHIFRELETNQKEKQFFGNVPVLDLATFSGFSTEERRAILRKHLEAMGEPITETVLDDILAKDVSGPVFPWCISRYTEQQKASLDRLRAFWTPEMTYAAFLANAVSDKEYGHLIAAMLRLTFRTEGFRYPRNSAREELLALGHSSCNLQQLDAVARHLTESYFSSEKWAGQCLAFQDVAVLTLGTTDLSALLEICSMKCLIQYVHTEDTGARISVRVPRNSPEYEMLHQRLHTEVSQGNLLEVVQHPSMHSSQYLSDFGEFLENTGSLQEIFSAADSVFSESLLYWSVFSSPSTLTQWCVRRMPRSIADDCEISDCLMRMLFFSALCEDDDLYNGVRKVAFSVKTLRYLAGAVGDTELHLPGKEQRYTASTKINCRRFEEKTLSGTVCYLGDPSLQVPAAIFRAETLRYTARLIFPTRQWYLALRLLADRQVDETDDEGNTLLHVAADVGDVDAVEIAVKSGASLAALNNNQQTSVTVALNKRQQESSGASEPSSQQTRAFFKRCAEGDVEQVKVLLCLSAGVDDKDSLGQTALHVACQAGQEPVANLLIQVGANVRAKTREGLTPLHMACGRGRKDIAELLITHGALVNLVDFSGQAPLHAACVTGNTDIVTLLFRHQTDVNVKDHEGFTPLHLACRKGHRQLAELLIRRGANVNSQNTFASTPLHYACSTGHYDIAVLLLENSADVRAKTTRGSTPLHLACQEGKRDLAELLIRRHADVNARNASGSTALHAACFFERKNVIALLLQHGADPSKKNDDGYTPLHLACERGDTKTAEHLIQQGADVHPTDRSGFTALHYSSFYGHFMTTVLLLRHHADVNATTRPNRFTPLSLASQRGHQPIVELLIEHNADVNAKDRAGLRPLDRARKNAHAETAALLVQNGARCKRRHFRFALVFRRK